MTRKFTENTLVLATHNAGKLVEIRDLLAPFGVEATSVGELNLPEPEETETTFIGNARLKAHAASQASGLPALADDSGFSVAVLDGAPGVYSARWAGETKDFALAMQRVHDEMGVHDTSAACFTCALCLAWPDGDDACFEGIIQGQVTWPPRGDKGFGYDPMFVPEGETRSFGEMTMAEKRLLSHRGRAFDAFVAAYFELPVIEVPAKS